MKKEQENSWNTVWTHLILPGFAIFVIYVLCYFLRGTLISLFLAFTVAYIFNPVINFLERRGFRRELGIAILIISVLLSTTGFLMYVIPKTITGVYQVGTKVKEQYPKYQPTFDEWVTKYGNTGFAQSLKLWLNNHAEAETNREPVGFKPVDTSTEIGMDSNENVRQTPPSPEEPSTQKQSTLQKRKILETVWELKKYLPQVGSFSLNIVKNVFYSAFGFFGIVINCIIFSVVSIYLLKDFNVIAQHLKDMFPLPKRGEATRLISKINDNLRSFLQGQLIICLILSLIYSIGLTIAGVPLSFLIGFIGGFGNLIPYVGTGIGMALAIMLALFQYHDFNHVVYVIVTFGVGQMLEGTVITPRVMSKGLGLSPVMIILSILIFSQLLGFLGLLLAVPIASTVQVFIDEFIMRYKSSPYYKGDLPE